jgi:threonine dehydrogenase-like Zn-dependent dehydrogenase
MRRVIKPEGFGNVQIEEVPIPAIAERQVLVRNHVTLISRGSELFARYNQERAVNPAAMGYSATGIVAAVGSAVTEFRAGDRVMVVAPHAEYVVGDVDSPGGARFVHPLPDDVSFEQAAFLPLASAGVEWAASAPAPEDGTVVILGQGLVGNLVMQAWREYRPKRRITVDALPLRCRLSSECGADVVVNAAEEDPVAAVRRLTEGRGAGLVVDCVGGSAGVKSFEQAQEMIRRGGVIHLIALYQGGPLPLQSSRIMDGAIIAGRHHGMTKAEACQRTLGMIQRGEMRVTPLTTHRFPFQEARAAFDLLWEKPGEALGVLLQWD